MIPLKWLLFLSGALAAFSLLTIPVLIITGRFSWLESALSAATYCGLGSVALLVIGLFMHRGRGLWLVIPAMVALVTPLYLVVSLITGIEGRVQQHGEQHRDLRSRDP